MVSVSKMAQSSRWFLQLVLLCCCWELNAYGSGKPEYSSIRIYPEDQGEILLFLVNVGVHLVGKKLDKGYRCPVYCTVDHVHIFWEYEEKNTNEGDIQAVDGVHQSARVASKK